MIEWCDCEYSYEFMKYIIKYKLEGQEPEYLEITQKHLNDPWFMNQILPALVLLHRRCFTNADIRERGDPRP